MLEKGLKKSFLILYILLTILFIQLNGCSTYHRKDGPPPFPVDETKISNAVPKKEPFSKYGNLTSYRVFGKRYYTLKTNKNYRERGIASWYGTQFHRARTSSGERYNMLAMTAAHKSLPLPTYVQVTNLKNKKQIIVKVNDRGPFEKNRLIDLSYVAAKKLGMIGHGTAYVEVKAIDPDTWNKQKEKTIVKPLYAYSKQKTPIRHVSDDYPKEKTAVKPLYAYSNDHHQRNHYKNSYAHTSQYPKNTKKIALNKQKRMKYYRNKSNLDLS